MTTQQKIKQTAGHSVLGEFAPKFAQLNDNVLFGETVWNDSTLNLHDRSMVTISILLGKGLIDTSFKSHLEMGKKHGITRQEIAALLTQAAFYAGWPNAWAGFRMAKEVWADNETATEKERFQQEMIFPIGEPNTAYEKYFSGNSYLSRISDSQISFSNVTFEPGCRNNWHIHHATKGGGQMLVGIAGRGWYKEEGKPAIEILPGSVIHIPANTKHWHGAAKDSWFAHLAFEIPGENNNTEWLAPVTDEEYLNTK
ncbi:carboxymuconolactone decarboxylase family protein [uncultured Muribaculum sp.]|uniref:carboxymuconolactone decarboxylase family protein n=1 Tax=uncultured Muribaculum sp. TaxID=1918613 RepID=UPI0025AF6891|nr:carboxymuconolactone decarboxylase family protein [uncultured Muribaculum sp.]